jgi:hypothetical protein
MRRSSATPPHMTGPSFGPEEHKPTSRRGQKGQRKTLVTTKRDQRISS